MHCCRTLSYLLCFLVMPFLLNKLLCLRCSSTVNSSDNVYMKHSSNAAGLRLLSLTQGNVRTNKH